MLGNTSTADLCSICSFCCWSGVQYCGRAVGHGSKELSAAKGASGLRRMKRVSPLGSISRTVDGLAILN